MDILLLAVTVIQLNVFKREYLFLKNYILRIFLTKYALHVLILGRLKRITLYGDDR